MRTNLNSVLIVFLFRLPSCFFMKPTDPEQVKKDVIGYLEKTYKKKFGVEKIEGASNEGNGCLDGHIVKSF